MKRVLSFKFVSFKRIAASLILASASVAFGDGTPPNQSPALEASHIFKASSGNLIQFDAHNTKASAQYILLIDSATVPSNGAVTLLYPPIYIPANGNASLRLAIPIRATNGIVACNSSTDTFTLTAGSADCILNAQVQ
jgi:hypothetical protein